MAAYRQVYGYGHLRADCWGPGPEPYARFEYGTTFTFTASLGRLRHVLSARVKNEIVLVHENNVGQMTMPPPTHVDSAAASQTQYRYTELQCFNRWARTILLLIIVIITAW